MNPSQNRGSWDAVIISDNIQGLSPPIFIEVKSSLSDASSVVSDLNNKILLTKQIILQTPQVITSQILQDRTNGPSLNLSDAEFVVFTEGTYVQELVDYIDSATNPSLKMNLVIWGYNFQNANTQVISIPYAGRQGIRTCRNTNGQNCNICLCIHQDRGLMNFLQNIQSQFLERGRIIPSARKYIDPAINIVSILSFGEVFLKEDKNLTEAVLRERIGSFLSKFYISVSMDDIDRIIGEMKAAGIILPSRGVPIPSYHLTSSIKAITSKEDDLIAEVTNRAVKKLRHARTLDQF